MSDIQIRPMIGPDVKPYIGDLAKLRIKVFREFPYLYEGTAEYEEKYLKSYAESPESLVVVVFHKETIIGASTGIPLDQAMEESQTPFLQYGYALNRIFYFGESVLLKEFRGFGIGVRFFEERESYANRLGRFDYTAFCAVERPDNHPRKPSDYSPLDRFWENRGYRKHPEMKTLFSWQEIDEPGESPKPMIFWLKSLR